MRYLLTVSLLLYNLFSFSQNKELKSSFVKKLPVLHKAVNDFGRFLTSSEKTTLEIELKSYLKQTSNAIVIVTLDSLTDPKTKQEYTVEDAASLYFNTWGIGDSIKNNGVLLLASRTPRRVRIEVGKGLSAVLDDNYCQGVIDNNLVPAFKKGSFFTGFKDAITALENRLDNPPAAQAIEEPAQPASESFTTITNEETSNDNIFFILERVIGGIIVFVFIVIIATVRMWLRVPAGSYSSGGYQRQGFGASNDDERWDNNSSSSSSDSSSSFFSSSSDSSSSSSSSSDSYSGGSSDGGGASGSW